MGEAKVNISAKKLRGGYYTPKPIADFLCGWSINCGTQSVLEPSCGDGNFIESAIQRFNELGIKSDDLEDRIKGIEFLEEESIKACNRAVALGLNSNTIVNGDFFKYIKKNRNPTFDVIIGNPPFIRYQNFPEEHRSIAFDMMKDLGLNPNKLTNIWVPFLIVSASLLNDSGKMAMVIPAELFQVKYAEETRVFLSNYFDRLTIVTFKKLVFDNIQQEVVLLLCEKNVDRDKGIRVLECESLEDLNSIDFSRINGSNVKPIDHASEKWTKYFLDEAEILLLKKLKFDNRVVPLGDILDADVGIVTGRNKFFMLKEEQVKQWKLQKYTIPVVSKSHQLRGISFTKEDFLINSLSQNSIHLFIPPNKDFSLLPNVCKQYIKYGEEEEFNIGYKTRIRKRWYITPSLWIPDAFALRQVGDYPKLILNESGAASTDTIHRVRFKDDINRQLVAVSFINSLTYAFSEITGRSYGGGVLTFEPTEIEDLRIPRPIDINVDFKLIDSLIRERRIEEALDIVDNELLIKQYGFCQDEVLMLRGIWEKLSSRRNSRKR